MDFNSEIIFPRLLPKRILESNLLRDNNGFAILDMSTYSLSDLQDLAKKAPEHSHKIYAYILSQI